MKRLFIKKKFIKYHIGNKEIRSHIEALHAAPPKAEIKTAKIIIGVVNKINCSGIISTRSRIELDLNRRRNDKNKTGIDEYRNIIRQFLEYLSILNKNQKLIKPYLHLSIHGMADNVRGDIEVGTLFGKTCQIEVQDWIIRSLGQKINKKIILNRYFSGNGSKVVHRVGDLDTDYLGFGSNFNTFQIEINKTLREKYLGELIDIFSEIILEFNLKFK